MNDLVTLKAADQIATVTISRPPVNAINRDIRAGLKEVFLDLNSNEKIQAVIIQCSGRTFMAGADLKEFDEPIAEPSYHEVFELIENCSKPVIAAMHGTALGAGLELALACHYRCGVKSLRLGLPEVSLGIIPGAGGSQRLPRLIGAKAALKLILGIAPINAEKAESLGILDHLFEEDLETGSLNYAQLIINTQLGVRKTSAMEVDVSGYDDQFLAEARKLASKTARGQNAPELVIKSINNAINLSFEKGIKAELQIAEKSLVSEEAKALRYIFFAEREVGSIPEISRETLRYKIENVAVIGAGTMGRGIAMSFADAGLPVTLFEKSEDALQDGIQKINSFYQNTVDRGRLSEKDMVKRMKLISGVADYSTLADNDLVIEAIYEDLNIKKDLFALIDNICKPEAILATNTSTLDIDEIAKMTDRPEMVLGLHFFSPANVMKLLEIVRAKNTAPEVLATAVDLAKRIKKVGVVAGVCFGFIGNRMMAEGFHREADQMLLEGASPEQVDRVMRNFGFPMGPFTMHDMAGVDIMHSILKKSGKKQEYHVPYFNVLYQVGENARFGQKTGLGFYRYERDSRTPHHDPAVDKIIAEEAEKLGITRSKIEDIEIEERCIYSLINEGAKVLEDGISYRAGDIDVIWCYGYGFPRFRGGPMYLADQIGLDQVLAKVVSYMHRFGDIWKPAPLLEKLVEEKTTFGNWSINASKKR
ncbi:MAG: 3-hydroxyacyl-CoA dehydrogenase NAD-binding domain-containing protein [Pseudomonadota bacterium]|nr:3-hydroxyacyl-CoA dehydrogenase NAD-binding domain-containing protein [Pseudomonadota bacterium]